MMVAQAKNKKESKLFTIINHNLLSQTLLHRLPLQQLQAAQHHQCRLNLLHLKLQHKYRKSHQKFQSLHHQMMSLELQFQHQIHTLPTSIQEWNIKAIK